jgi:hypothetical protein
MFRQDPIAHPHENTAAPLAKRDTCGSARQRGIFENLILRAVRERLQCKFADSAVYKTPLGLLRPIILFYF